MARAIFMQWIDTFKQLWLSLCNGYTPLNGYGYLYAMDRHL